MNLSLEDYIFRNFTVPPIIIYRNKPSVIIGRNQNPWYEANLPFLAERGIEIVRRRSGGGTVYHDLGNTNYSVMMHRSDFDRNRSAQKLVNYLQDMGKPVRVNDRHDIVMDTPDGQVKVSGSAYKISKDRAYAHGTMLLNSDLEHLRPALHSKMTGMDVKGVESVRSRVGNIGISHEDMYMTVAKAFDAEVEMLEEKDILKLEGVEASISELEGWTWKFGQTPEFTHNIVLPMRKDINMVQKSSTLWSRLKENRR